MDDDLSGAEEPTPPDPRSGESVTVDLGDDRGTLTLGDTDRDGRADWVDATGPFETALEDEVPDVLAEPDLVVEPDDPGVAESPEPAAPDAPSPAVEAGLVDETPFVHGDPRADMRWSLIQSENGFCVPAATGMIVSEFGGALRSEQEMVGAAIELNLLYGEPGAWVGMTTEGTVDLLEHFGVSSHVEYGTLDDLRHHLDAERGIVLMVDANEMGSASPDDLQLADAGADHAVVITGVNDARSTITVNDPGRPDGAGWEISIADLMDAWDDSNYEMVVTDAAPASGEAVHGSLSAIRHPAGYVLLPVVVGEETLRRPNREILGQER